MYFVLFYFRCVTFSYSWIMLTSAFLWEPNCWGACVLLFCISGIFRANQRQLRASLCTAGQVRSAHHSALRSPQCMMGFVVLEQITITWGKITSIIIKEWMNEWMRVKWDSHRFFYTEELKLKLCLWYFHTYENMHDDNMRSVNYYNFQFK